MKLILWLCFTLFVVGCQATSHYRLESHISDTEWTVLEGTMGAKDVQGGVYLQIGDAILQTGDVVTAPDPYAAILNQAIQRAIPLAMCAQNPIFCVNTP